MLRSRQIKHGADRDRFDSSKIFQITENRLFRKYALNIRRYVKHGRTKQADFLILEYEFQKYRVIERFDGENPAVFDQSRRVSSEDLLAGHSVAQRIDEPG